MKTLVRDCSRPGIFAIDPETGEEFHVSAGLDELGREVGDPVPMEVPLHLQSGPSLSETVRRLVAGELSRSAGEAGNETFEEADDFDTGPDDPVDFGTPYEEEFDPGPPLRAAAEKRAREAEAETSGTSSSAAKEPQVAAPKDPRLPLDAGDEREAEPPPLPQRDRSKPAVRR